VAFRLRISSKDGASDGMLAASVDGDAFEGVDHVPMYRPGAPEYQPKWGLYRGQSDGMPIGDDYLEHRDIQANQVKDAPAAPPTEAKHGGEPSA
jgi:hypothetical protein